MKTLALFNKKAANAGGIFKKIPMSWYLKAPGVSSHALHYMARSPAHFKAALNAPEEEPTPVQILGTIIHTAVFEPERLETSYYIRPETYESRKGPIVTTKPWNANSNSCSEWLSAHRDRPVIREPDHETVIAVRKSIHEHPSACVALAQGEPELSLFARDPERDLMLKARPDWLTGNTIINLKSCEDASTVGFAKAVANYNYHVSAAFHLDVCNLLGLQKEFYLFIAVEKEPPYAIMVHDLQPSAIKEGRKTYQRSLDLLSHCLEYDEWPAYPTDIQPLSLPPWKIKNNGQLLIQEQQK